MKTRSEVVKFIHNTDPGMATPDLNFKNPYKGVGERSAWHYGVCELRQLLDFIYNGHIFPKKRN